jgi:hypothetical protein
MGRGAGALALRPPPASDQEAQMDILAIRIARSALPAALALALLLAPIQARTGEEPTDYHEIPKFVLERTEIVTGVD